jgi:hypothetical protein
MNFFPASSPAARYFDEMRNAIPTLGLACRRGERFEAAVALRGLPAGELLAADDWEADMAEAVRAGLLLRAGLDEESHEVSQAISTREGSFWHGIIHRREPDYSNAGYWFRRVGSHPLLEQIAREARAARRLEAVVREAVAGGVWDPFRFIDLCEACEEGKRADLRPALEAAQAIEVEALLAYCMERAVAPRGGAAQKGRR